MLNLLLDFSKHLWINTYMKAWIEWSVLFSGSFLFLFALVGLTRSFAVKCHMAQVGNISRGGAQHGTTTPLRAACSSQKKPVEFAFIVGVVKRSTRVEQCSTYARPIHPPRASGMEIRQRISSPFLQCTNRWENYYLVPPFSLSLALCPLFASRIALLPSHRANRTILASRLRARMREEAHWRVKIKKMAEKSKGEMWDNRHRSRVRNTWMIITF